MTKILYHPENNIYISSFSSACHFVSDRHFSLIRQHLHGPYWREIVDLRSVDSPRMIEISEWIDRLSREAQSSNLHINIQCIIDHSDRLQREIVDYARARGVAWRYAQTFKCAADHLGETWPFPQSGEVITERVVSRQIKRRLEAETRDGIKVVGRWIAGDVDLVDELMTAIGRMRNSEDMSHIVTLILRRLSSTSMYAISINSIHPDNLTFTTWVTRRDGFTQRFSYEDEALLNAWRHHNVIYRSDLFAGDDYGDRGLIHKHHPGVRSVIDIPFSGGTFGVSSLLPNAFSQNDITLFQGIARALSMAFARLGDLSTIEQYRSTLNEQNLLIASLDRLIESTDYMHVEEMLNSLSIGVIEAGLFRSLTVGIVKNDFIHIVRNYVCIDGERITEGQNIRASTHRMVMRDATLVRHSPIIGRKIHIDDMDDLMAQCVRSGELVVHGGFGHALSADRSVPQPTDRGAKIAYFIPIKRGDRVLAVLATGSTLKNADRIFHKIDTMQPLFRQIAITLDYGATPRSPT